MFGGQPPGRRDVRRTDDVHPPRARVRARRMTSGQSNQEATTPDLSITGGRAGRGRRRLARHGERVADHDTLRAVRGEFVREAGDAAEDRR